MNTICPRSHRLKQTGTNCMILFIPRSQIHFFPHSVYFISEVFPKWGTCVHCHPSACFHRVWKITNQRLALFPAWWGTKGPCPVRSPLSAYWLQQCLSSDNTAEGSTPFPLESLRVSIHSIFPLSLSFPYANAPLWSLSTHPHPSSAADKHQVFSMSEGLLCNSNRSPLAL